MAETFETTMSRERYEELRSAILEDAALLADLEDDELVEFDHNLDYYWFVAEMSDCYQTTRAEQAQLPRYDTGKEMRRRGLAEKPLWTVR